MDKRYWKSKFTNEFVKKAHGSPVSYQVLLWLEHIDDPYKIIETLVGVIEKQAETIKQQEEELIESHKYYTLPSISEEEFKQFITR